MVGVFILEVIQAESFKKLLYTLFDLTFLMLKDAIFKDATVLSKVLVLRQCCSVKKKYVCCYLH